MSPITELDIFAVSIVLGLLGSMLGLGAGVFIVPILSTYFGIPLKIAIAASALSVVVNSVSGATVYLRQRLTNLRLGVLMEMTTTLGAVGGGLLAVAAPVATLRVVLGSVLLAFGLASFRKRRLRAAEEQGPDPFGLRHRFHDPAQGQEVTYTPHRVIPGMLLSSVAGVLSGLLGIGGGPIKVSLMNTVMGVPVKAAAATSIYMVGITVSASALVYYRHGLIDPSVAVPALLGVLIGSQIGARLVPYVSSSLLLRILAVVLVYLGTTLLLQAMGIHVPGTTGP